MVGLAAGCKPVNGGLGNKSEAFCTQMSRKCDTNRFFDNKISFDGWFTWSLWGKCSMAHLKVYM